VYAQSTQRRFSRWLHNSRINVVRLYGPLIGAALSDWQEANLDLSLDTRSVWCVLSNPGVGGVSRVSITEVYSWLTTD
jgi:hypothetical protein